MQPISSLKNQLLILRLICIVLWIFKRRWRHLLFIMTYLFPAYTFQLCMLVHSTRILKVSPYLLTLSFQEISDIIKNSFITFTVENPITFFYISRHICFFAFLIYAPGKSRIFLILIFSDYGCINRNCLSTIVAYCISFNRCNLR